MRRVLIVGATSAILQPVGRKFARDGAQICLAGRNLQKLEAIAQDLETLGAHSVKAIAFDAEDGSTHESMLEQARAFLQGWDLVLVGHGYLPQQSDCEKAVGKTHQVFQINLMSVISLLTPIANAMEKQRSGTIAVISSVAGERGRTSNYVYGASKAALNVFLQGMRNRLTKSGVSVLTIKPGFVDTPMTAHLKKGLLFASPDSISDPIYRSIQQKRDIVFVPSYWRWIMWVIRNIPEFIFKRMTI